MMMLRHTFALIIISILTTSTFAQQQKRKILFVGNSYTYVNNLPQLIHDIAASKGDSIIFDSNTPGGYTLQMHSVDATTLTKIKAAQWDFVVLQAQSQEPSFDPAQVQTQTYPYARILNDSIKANNPCTETVFYMTWGRQNGDASNCSAYPPVCTYDGMQSRLRESYLEMTDSNRSTCSPVGMAWKYARLQYPAINLYQTDQSHPSIEGSYLAACVFYATLFQKTPIGATYTSSLNNTDATALQNIASTTVFDSLSLWRIKANYPQVSFSSTLLSPLNYQFTNTSTNSQSYIWDFGDGATSTLQNPAHAFAINGAYTIQLLAANNCFKDSVVALINTGNTSVSTTSSANDIHLYYQNTSETIIIESNMNEIGQLFIYDNIGKIISEQKNINKQSIVLSTQGMIKGIYLILMVDKKGNIISRKVVID